MIGFACAGVVPGLPLTMLILLIFSVGYGALTCYVDRPGAFVALFGGVWRTMVAPLLGLAGISVVFVLSVSNLDELIGAGTLVSAAPVVTVPLVIVIVGFTETSCRIAEPGSTPGSGDSS